MAFCSFLLAVIGSRSRAIQVYKFCSVSIPENDRTTILHEMHSRMGIAIDIHHWVFFGSYTHVLHAHGSPWHLPVAERFSDPGFV